MAEASRQYTHDDYTVGWICALPKTELVAASAMLDIKHPVLSAADSKDTNSYLFGSIGAHNVVIACLPAQETGKVNAATVAKDMMRSFKAVRFGLMVGIGGGVPRYGDSDKYESDNSDEGSDSGSQNSDKIKDIRLGDIVVGLHSKTTEAVEQYDFGKSIQGRGFVSAGGRLNKSPQIVLAAVAMLQGQHILNGSSTSKLVSETLSKYPGIQENFSYPGLKKDRLFKADIRHVEGKRSCKACCGPLDSNLVVRSERDGNAPKIHYGTIGSADQVMEDAVLRDKLAQEKDIICFEMEAAGLMDSFPCLVIRGICDYADSHKTKIWQPYAALTAAAYAKELLSVIPATEISKLPLIEVVEQINRSLDRMQQISHNTNAHVLDMKTDSHTARITRWLSPADPSTNINNARQSRHEGTGTWFLKSQLFADWKHGFGQSLWLFGTSGCGKSVLSATILDNLAETENSTTLTLGFFFDFRDPKKQKLHDMLCFFASQIYRLRPGSRQVLDRLFVSHQDGQQHPNTTNLSNCLRNMLKAVYRVAILIDALDECSERPTLLKWMKDFFPSQPQARILCTSRPDSDIERSISSWISHCVPLNNDTVNADIRSYIKARLHTSEEFKRWIGRLSVLEEIENTLSRKVDGQFRLAACQLDRLEKCRERPAVREVLKTLPSDINGIYARILEDIPEECKDRTIRLIQFLVYSYRPLTLEEAVDVAAVNIGKRHFDPDDRLPCPEEITAYCSSLVSILENSEEHSYTVQLAHSSVKEYFENCGKAAFIKPEPMAVITQTCLAYLSSIPMNETLQLRSDYPLARYAAETWMTCARHAEFLPPVLEQIMEFLRDTKKFRLWASLYNPDQPWYLNPGEPKAGPLYFACSSGLTATALALVSQKVDINARGGDFNSALQAASFEGYFEIVHLLLANGADVKMQGGLYGSALEAASSRGHFKIAQLLLKVGAEVNTSNALRAASLGGHRKVVQLLLDNGAEVNTQRAMSGSALQAASLNGHHEVVQLLLENKAKVNTQTAIYGSALQAASLGGYRKVVQLLLDNGADINLQSGIYGSALQSASSGGSLEIVQLFLKMGADVNAQASISYGTALDAALLNGHRKVVQLLLKVGAEVNHRNALRIASLGGYGEIVQLLSDNGVTAHAQDYDGTALQANSYPIQRSEFVENGGYDGGKIIQEPDKRHVKRRRL